MAQHPPPDIPPPDAPPPTPAAARGRQLRPVRSGLVAAVAFVLGLLAGAVAAGVLGGGPAVLAPPEAAPASPTRGGALPAEDASAEFVVSAACFGAVNAAQDTLLVVDDVGEAAAELDAARLEDVVHRLMPLQTRLQRGIDACEVSTEVEGATGPESALPAPGSDEAGD